MNDFLDKFHSFSMIFFLKNKKMKKIENLAY